MRIFFVVVCSLLALVSGSTVTLATEPVEEGETSVLEEEEEEVTLLAGLRGHGNLGATCYFNALLQVLEHARVFYEYFLRFDYITKHGEDLEAKVFNGIVKVTSMQWSENPEDVGQAFIPRSFLSALRESYGGELFTEHHQQDSHEAYNFMIQSLDNAVEHLKAKNVLQLKDVSIFSEFFRVQTESRLYCSVNDDVGVKSVSSPEIMISMEIPDVEVTIPLNIAKVFNGVLLQNYDCPDGKHGAIKKERLVSTPKLLMVAPQRTKWVNGRQGKISTPLQAPLDLHLASIEKGKIKPIRYRLIGIVYHHGASGEGGHYTASFLHPIDNYWYLANDAWITAHENNLPELVSKNGRLYLYERVDE